MNLNQFLRLTLVVAFIFLSVFPTNSFAFNVNVTQGNATVTQKGNSVIITAQSPTILQGNTSIPKGLTVYILQGSNNILLRDTTGTVTNILGSLLSNGNIILINTMGVFIGPSANVSVAGLMASTLDIKNSMFLNGNYQFTQVPGLNPAQILNEANIKVPNGGYVVLVGGSVINKGTITAYLGSVALGSGQQATVSFDQTGLVNLVINEGLVQELQDSNGKPTAQIVNTGDIYASGGRIEMTAQLLKSTFEGVINNTGIVEATSVVQHGGEIDLDASGAITNSGIISAGTLNVQAPIFDSSNGLSVGVGNFNSTIDLSGYIQGVYSDVDNIDFAGIVDLSGDTSLETDSGQTGTTGNIVMNGYSLNGNGFNLSMTAGLNDVLNGSIKDVNLFTLNSSTLNNVTFSSTGDSFNVNTLQTNSNSIFSRSQGKGTLKNPYMIYSDSNAPGGLQYITTSGLGSYYELANNINASDTSTWNGGQGFVPIGTSSLPFIGNLNGNSYTISGLYIDLHLYVALFGYIANGASISNVGIVNDNITGNEYVGGLVGYNNGGTISNSYNTGSIVGTDAYVGGLVGENFGLIKNSYNTGTVSSDFEEADQIGGLVGINFGSITNSSNSGSVSGESSAGGMAGENDGSIINSYNTGSVSGEAIIGGIIGKNDSNGSIINAYNTGSIFSAVTVGGLAGENQGSIISSYNSGEINSNNGNEGGLVGENTGSITDSYNTGAISGFGNVYLGGLVGLNGGTITGSYNLGAIAPGNYDVGGLAGENSGSITTSYNGISLSGSQYAGGLVGDNFNAGSITNSYNTGNIIGANDAGGLVGSNSGSIANSYNTGNISGGNLGAIGGLVGGNSGSIRNSYNTGSVSSNSGPEGGLVGLEALGSSPTAVDFLFNDWWNNNLSNGLGEISQNGQINLSPPSSSMAGSYQEAGSVSDFYNRHFAVYTSNIDPWNFSTIWKATSTYPVLIPSTEH